ncbi:MAG TPA: winged helix-turn-helix domain-containing protein [Terriglobia bacterium]|nr:winged helix-turn-helix domain-containing protein [Terriglobia bacterium]
MKSSEGPPSSREHANFYEFGPFRLDPVKRTLWRGAKAIPLTGRAFDTLLILIQNRGQTVGKDVLIQQVWGEIAIEENNLTQSISALRKAFGESKSDHKYIVTFPSVGYRFVAEVTETPYKSSSFVSATPETSESVPNEHGKPAGAILQARYPAGKVTIGPEGLRRPSRSLASLQAGKIWLVDAVRLPLGAALALCLAALAIAGYLLARSGRLGMTKTHTATRIMVAVLPFYNLTGDSSQEYISDGLTEEIITQLGRSNPAHLGIIAHTSVMRYKGANKSLREIARELGVDYLVEGSVRRADGQARISVQLIRPSDRAQVWAQSYERPLANLLGLEADVAGDVQSAIAQYLGLASAPAHVAPGTPNSEAYEAYLKGVYFFNRRDGADLLKAVGSFQQAVRIDPRYAMAYAGLANAYTVFALDGEPPQGIAARAKEASLKAVDLDGSLAESRTALGATRAVFDWDWPGAGREFLRALAADPNDALAHQWYAAFDLVPQGRYSEAVTEIRAAQTLDPVSLIVNTDLGWAYFISGRDRAALFQYRKTLDLDPNFVPVHFRLSEFYLAKKMYSDWAKEVAEDERLLGDPKQADAVEVAYRRAGYRGALTAFASFEAQHSPSQPSALFDEAYESALLGHNNRAIRVLAAMCDRHDPALLYIKVDPAFASLRSDPRFHTIEHRMGLEP